MSTLLTTLRAEREKHATRAEELIAVQEGDEARVLTDEERTEFESLTTELRDVNERLSAVKAIHESRAASAAESARITVKSEPLTYNRGVDESVSYFRDLAADAGMSVGVDRHTANARLQRHGKEMDVELPSRLESRERAAQSATAAIGASNAFEKRAANRTDGTGGYFVPPLWLIDEYIKVLRFGRPFVDSLRQIDLPQGTDSINIPVLSTGTATAVQTADNAAVTSVDITDSSVSAGVKTIAGQEDVSLQLLEQSRGQIIDQVIMEDLIADYNMRCDIQALQGSGASGQVQGIDGLTGTNAVTFTSGAPTVPLMFTPLAQAVSLLAQNRKRLDGVQYWMHPRRWFWGTASQDTTNRQLVIDPAAGAYNPTALVGAPAAEGYVGRSANGYAISIDGNIRSNAGAGTNQDVVYAVRGDDCLWFEGELRTRVLPEILSGTLGVRFQAYNYIAFLVRYANAISIVNGTGFVAPAGY